MAAREIADVRSTDTVAPPKTRRVAALVAAHRLVRAVTGMKLGLDDKCAARRLDDTRSEDFVIRAYVRELRGSAGRREGGHASRERGRDLPNRSIDEWLGKPTVAAADRTGRGISTTNVVGIHMGHNSSAAMVRDGVLVSGIQEERLSRIKNQGDFPSQSLQNLFGAVPLGAVDSARFAYAWKRVVRSIWQRNAILKGYDKPRRGLVDIVKGSTHKIDAISELINARRVRTLETLICKSLPLNEAPVERIEHHLSHASAAYFGWGRPDEKILVLTCDGSGDGICASVNVGHYGSLQRLAAVDESHSIGRLYACLTFLMGMVPLEHEYKVMGLAPYGEKSREAVEFANQLHAMFEIENNRPLVWTRKNCPPLQGGRGYLQKLIYRKRFDHVAGGLQLFIEQFLVQWVRNCIRETGIGKVALSGGVFMNVKANQRILEIPELEELFVFPSCGDETNAIGAAWSLYRTVTGRIPSGLKDMYLGGESTDDEIEAEISKYKFAGKVKIAECGDIESNVADLLAHGAIVARHKGRMEFGARALGNRSILANASDARCVREINEMIKSRDFWMPFAPSVLAERSDDYFVKPKPMSAPYMIMTFDTKEARRDKIIAAIHPFDFTARPQEVYEQWNPDYYRLLKEFEARTGEGVILNTSFNLHGEPIVCSPRDSLRVFELSGLRHLALGNFHLSKG